MERWPVTRLDVDFGDLLLCSRGEEAGAQTMGAKITRDVAAPRHRLHEPRDIPAIDPPILQFARSLATGSQPKTSEHRAFGNSGELEPGGASHRRAEPLFREGRNTNRAHPAHFVVRLRAAQRQRKSAEISRAFTSNLGGRGRGSGATLRLAGLLKSRATARTKPQCES